MNPCGGSVKKMRKRPIEHAHEQSRYASREEFPLEVVGDHREQGRPSKNVGHEGKERVGRQIFWAQPGEVSAMVFHGHHPTHAGEKAPWFNATAFASID